MLLSSCCYPYPHSASFSSLSSCCYPYSIVVILPHVDILMLFCNMHTLCMSLDNHKVKDKLLLWQIYLPLSITSFVHSSLTVRHLVYFFWYTIFCIFFWVLFAPICHPAMLPCWATIPYLLNFFWCSTFCICLGLVCTWVDTIVYLFNFFWCSIFCICFLCSEIHHHPMCQSPNLPICTHPKRHHTSGSPTTPSTEEEELARRRSLEETQSAEKIFKNFFFFLV